MMINFVCDKCGKTTKIWLGDFTRNDGKYIIEYDPTLPTYDVFKTVHNTYLLCDACLDAWPKMIQDTIDYTAERYANGELNAKSK